MHLNSVLINCSMRFRYCTIEDKDIWIVKLMLSEAGFCIVTSILILTLNQVHVTLDYIYIYIDPHYTYLFRGADIMLFPEQILSLYSLKISSNRPSFVANSLSLQTDENTSLLTCCKLRIWKKSTSNPFNGIMFDERVKQLQLYTLLYVQHLLKNLHFH